MYKITYQNLKEHSSIKHTKNFENLDELQDWIFKTAIKNIEGTYEMSFPNEKYIYPIRWWLGRDDGTIMIRLIESNNGILFSEGTYTSNQKFIAKKILNWCIEMKEKCKNGFNPKYNFIEEE